MRNPATEPIRVEDIVKVYSGRPGCGCGCLGTYWTDERNIKRIVKLMNANLGEVEVDNGDYTHGQVIYSMETLTRFMWAYTKEA